MFGIFHTSSRLRIYYTLRNPRLSQPRNEPFFATAIGAWSSTTTTRTATTARYTGTSRRNCKHGRRNKGIRLTAWPSTFVNVADRYKIVENYLPAFDYSRDSYSYSASNECSSIIVRAERPRAFRTTYWNNDRK